MTGIRIDNFMLSNFSEILMGDNLLVSGSVKDGILQPHGDHENYPLIEIEAEDALTLLCSLNIGGPNMNLDSYILRANEVKTGHRIGEGDEHFEVTIKNDSRDHRLPHVEVGFNRVISGYHHPVKTLKFCYDQDILNLSLHRAREIAFAAIDYYLKYGTGFAPAEKLLGIRP